MISLAILAASAAVSLTVPEGGEEENAVVKQDIAFHVMRKGEPIGFHSVRVEVRGEDTVVETLIRMKVKFGPLPLFRYSHSAREIWRDGVLISIESATNDNGESMSMKAWRAGGVLLIDGDAYAGPAPSGAAPSTYWARPQGVVETLISTQDGEMIPVETTFIGVTQAPNGRRAEQVRMTGTVELNLWYDGEEWIGASFVIDGEKLDYAPVSREEERAQIFARM